MQHLMFLSGQPLLTYMNGCQPWGNRCYPSRASELSSRQVFRLRGYRVILLYVVRFIRLASCILHHTSCGLPFTTSTQILIGYIFRFVESKIDKDIQNLSCCIVFLSMHTLCQYVYQTQTDSICIQVI